MASNYRKSFNFKNGVQVDTDNFVVDPIGRVGIGTSSPREFLDIYGNNNGAVRVRGPVRITGLTTTTKLYAGIGTIDNLIGTASSIGIGTFEQLQVGNSPAVTNLIGYAYTAWITDDGGIGLRTDSVVGIGTTTDANYALLIGSVPVEGVDGIGFKDGNIRATGVITATDFVGSLTGLASSATVLETSRNFEITGDLIGTAISFNGSDNVSIAGTLSTTFSAETTGIITAHTLSGVLTASSGYIGTATVKDLDQVTGGIATFVNIDGSYGNFDNLDVGVGTVKTLIADNSTQATTTLTVRNTNATDTSEISIGKSNTGGNQSAKISYTSGDKNLDIKNYDTGDINLHLHSGVTGVNTGGFKLKYKNDIIFHSDYEGNVSIKKDDADDGIALDVSGCGQFTSGLKVTGIVTVTQGNGSFELDPTDPPLLASSNIDITNENQNVLNRLQVGILSSTDPDTSLNLGINTTTGEPVLKIFQDNMTFGYDDNELGRPFTALFDNTNVSIAGTQGGKLTADRIEAIGGVSKIISPITITRPGNTIAGNAVISGINTSSLTVGLAVTHADPNVLIGGRTIAGFSENSITLNSPANGTINNGLFVIDNVGQGEVHLSGNLNNHDNRRFTKLGITTIYNDFAFQIGDTPTAPEDKMLYLDLFDVSQESKADRFLYLNSQVAVGIGTTTLKPYNTPGYNIILNESNPFIKRDSGLGIAGKLVIRRGSDQLKLDDGTASSSLISHFSPEGRDDPRISNTGSNEDWNVDLGVPHFNPGGNLDIDTISTSMIFDGSLSIVPFPAKAVSGYGDPGTPTGSYAQGGIAADNTDRTVDPNTGETHGDRLTMVGINTYIPRSVVDFSGASATMNSYMLIPSLSGSDITTMAALWQQTSGIGTAKAKRVTPNGVPGGALVYNTTTDTIQVRDTANSFRTLGSPKVVQGYVSNGQVSHGGSNLVTSEVSTGLSASITLRSSNSKVMVNVTQPFGGNDVIGEIILKRTIGGATQTLVITNHGSESGGKISGTASISYLDTPGNTGPVTYETFGRRVRGTVSSIFSTNSSWADSGSQLPRDSHITLMEIE